MNASFATTRWTVIVAAGRKGTPAADAALEDLCRTYWPPLYSWVRRHGRTPEDAQDLTQAFFERLLQRDWLVDVRREKGRFRSFLLVAFKRFLADEWDRTRARKRGGGAVVLSLDAGRAERLHASGKTMSISPECAFDREWALTLLDTAMERLRREYESVGKPGEYGVLKAYLTADRGEIPYADVAAKLGMTPGAARVAVHRLRRRFREVFRSGIADTVAHEDDVDDELRHLLGALGR